MGLLTMRNKRWRKHKGQLEADDQEIPRAISSSSSFLRALSVPRYTTVSFLRLKPSCALAKRVPVTPLILDRHGEFLRQLIREADHSRITWKGGSCTR